MRIDGDTGQLHVASRSVLAKTGINTFSVEDFPRGLYPDQTVSNLVSDVSGAAANTDSNLVNAWGLTSLLSRAWHDKGRRLGLRGESRGVVRGSKPRRSRCNENYRGASTTKPKVSATADMRPS
jgi:hypothetical protein